MGWITFRLQHGIKANEPKVHKNMTCWNQSRWQPARAMHPTDQASEKHVRYLQAFASLAGLAQLAGLAKPWEASPERLAEEFAYGQCPTTLKSKRRMDECVIDPSICRPLRSQGGVHPFFSRDNGDRRRHSNPRGPGRLGIRSQRRGRDAGGHAGAPRGCHGGKHDEHHVSLQVQQIRQFQTALAESCANLPAYSKKSRDGYIGSPICAHFSSATAFEAKAMFFLLVELFSTTAVVVRIPIVKP